MSDPDPPPPVVPPPPRSDPRAPQPGRVATHRPIVRGAGLPLVAKAVMALAIVALGAGVLYVAVGGLRTVAGGLGSTLCGLRP